MDTLEDALRDELGYELRPLVTGGATRAYEARDPSDGSRYFLKVYIDHSDEYGGPSAADFLEGQARIYAALRKAGRLMDPLLDHKVIRVPFGAREVDAYWQRKPWLEGRDLAKYLANTNSDIPAAPPEEQIALLEARLGMAVVLAGLVCVVHEQGIVHQDLKPQQFFLVDRPAADRPAADPRAVPFRIVIMDFDGAFFEGDKPLRVVHTVQYASPEQIEGRPATRASDVFSLALVVAEVLGVGLDPLLSEAEAEDFLTPRDLAQLHARGVVKRPLGEMYRAAFPDRADPDGLRALDDLLRRALDARPARRPTAAEFRNQLCAVRLFRSRVHDRPVPPPGPAPAPPSHSVPATAAWLRLRALNGVSYAFSGMKVGETLGLDREVARTSFRGVVDGSGNAFARYVGPGTAPILVVRRDPGGWSVRQGDGSKNTFELRRSSGGRVQLGKTFESVEAGDTLVVYRAAEGKAVEELAFRVECG